MIAYTTATATFWIAVAIIGALYRWWRARRDY